MCRANNHNMKEVVKDLDTGMVRYTVIMFDRKTGRRPIKGESATDWVTLKTIKIHHNKILFGLWIFDI